MIAIVGGTGPEGSGLALRWARAGESVIIGSRDAQRAQATAARIAENVGLLGSVEGSDNATAVKMCDMVVLTVPFAGQAELLKQLKPAFRPGTVLIDATVPLAAAVGGRPTRVLGVWQGSAAEQALEMVPEGVRVVSALHTISAASLKDLEHPLDQDVLVCGDSRDDKHEAAGLIERIDGLRCVDCGRLEMSRTTESLTALLIGVNARYKVHAGVRITNLPERLWK